MSLPNNNSNTQPIIDSELQEIETLKQKLITVEIPEDLRSKSLMMIERLTRVIKFGGYSREFESISTFVDWISKIPWSNFTKDNLDLDVVKGELDKHHYGLDDTKERLLEYLAVLKLNNQKVESEMALENSQDSQSMSKLQGSSSNAPILCFVGIQGVGKTSMAKSIANAIGRPFYRISLGGMTTVTALRGIAKGEADAEPGQIIKALVRSGTMTPVICLDEVDKISEGGGTRADIMAALLEILDPEQNSTFVDHYLDYPVNLSKVMFITTANNLGGISAALLDRLEVIRFSSYTDEDKIQIGRNYMLPKVLKATGLSSDQIKIDDEVWIMIVRPLGFDAGIRELERTITRLCRKVAMMIVRGEIQGLVITKDNFRTFIPEDFGILS